MNIGTVTHTEIISMALDSIRAHKFRSALTVLGIIIGVATVIAIASILTGLRENLVRLIQEYGTDNIYAFHLSTGFNPNQDREERTRKPLTEEDAVAIREHTDTVEDVALVAFSDWNFNRTITHQGYTYRRGNVQGVSANYAQTTNVSVSNGRFISDFDDQHRRSAMVIGVSVADALFWNHESAIGAQVKMGDHTFEVVGVLQKRKSAFLGENDEDNAVYIPFRTLRQISPGRRWMMLIIQAKAGKIRQALDQVEVVLRRQRGVKFNEANNFDLGTADRFISEFDNITKLAGLIAIAMSSVGLLVGGIGVMNIMLVSVTERTPEIGVRKALGARARDITTQFLCEAMTLTFLGGFAGVLLALAVSQIIMFFVPSLPASIPIWAVIAGLTVSVAVGLLFGVWPARKASRLDPVECLRYE
ncbi:MAG: multidrug ABC transporter substrate-binding protein [Acidobacteria bacterium]|nr:MAG: multidrug ABC transporter substrate-binding protein [Acidobacteriota bacterium]